MKTLLLDPVTWDLTIDASGNIAVADDPYAKAQDAASAIRTYLGEEWYDTTQGVPYKTILNQAPNLPYTRAKLQAAALTVPGVVSATVFFTSFRNRQLTGQVQVTDSTGQTAVANF